MRRRDRLGQSSEHIRGRPHVSRNIQQSRFTSPKSLFSNNSSSTDTICNADMHIGEIRKFCKLPEDGQSLMCAAMGQLNLSARAYHRTRSVKLARTIADLAGSEET